MGSHQTVGLQQRRQIMVAEPPRYLRIALVSKSKICQNKAENDLQQGNHQRA